MLISFLSNSSLIIGLPPALSTPAQPQQLPSALPSSTSAPRPALSQPVRAQPAIPVPGAVARPQPIPGPSSIPSPVQTPSPIAAPPSIANRIPSSTPPSPLSLQPSNSAPAAKAAPVPISRLSNSPVVSPQVPSSQSNRVAPPSGQPGEVIYTQSQEEIKVMMSDLDKIFMDLYQATKNLA